MPGLQPGCREVAHQLTSRYVVVSLGSLQFHLQPGQLSMSNESWGGQQQVQCQQLFEWLRNAIALKCSLFQPGLWQQLAQ